MFKKMKTGVAAVGLSGIVIATLGILKVCGVITVSWPVVLLPLWIIPALFLGIVAVVCALFAVIAIIAGILVTLLIILAMIGTVRAQSALEQIKQELQSVAANDGASA